MRSPSPLSAGAPCLAAALALGLVLAGCARGEQAPAPQPAPAAQPLAQPAAPASPIPAGRSPTLDSPIEWREFAPVQAGFKLRFPRLPERREKTEDSEDGPITQVGFIALAPEHDGAYSLAVRELPHAKVDKTPDEQYWKENTWVLVRNTVGDILEEKAIEVQGKAGKEFRLRGMGPHGKTTYFARIIRDGRRTFQLFAAYPEGKEKLEFARRYLDSFQFVD